MPKPETFWSEGDPELHEKVNETIRRHLIWSRRVNCEGTHSRFALRKIPVRKTLLPATKFENLQEYGCVICSSELNRSTVSCLYPCLHRFCYNCILKWLKVKSSCPLCLVTPTKLLYSIQSSSLFKETKLQHEFPNGDLRREGNHMRRLEEADIIPESQDTNEAYQQTLRGSRRQQELIVQREERLKLARQCKVEKC